MKLQLDNVTIRPCDILGQPGDGMRLLRDITSSDST